MKTSYRIVFDISTRVYFDINGGSMGGQDRVVGGQDRVVDKVFTS